VADVEHGLEHAAEAAHSGSSGGLPQLDFATWPGQIFWLLVTFGVLYLILSRSVLPRIGGVIEDRRDKIADDLDEAARLQRQAEDAGTAYEKSLADARAKAHTIAQDTHDAINAELAQESDAAEAQFAEKATEADARIRAATDAALANVKSVAEETASALVEKLAGAAPSATAARAAVDAADQG